MQDEATHSVSFEKVAVVAIYRCRAKPAEAAGQAPAILHKKDDIAVCDFSSGIQFDGRFLD